MTTQDKKKKEKSKEAIAMAGGAATYNASRIGPDIDIYKSVIIKAIKDCLENAIYFLHKENNTKADPRIHSLMKYLIFLNSLGDAYTPCGVELPEDDKEELQYFGFHEPVSLNEFTKEIALLVVEYAVFVMVTSFFYNDEDIEKTCDEISNKVKDYFLLFMARCDSNHCATVVFH